MFLGGIGARNESTPDEIALTDGTTTLTWSQLAATVVGAGARLLALPADSCLGVTGENAVPTLVSHLAGLVTGVGTVAVHRQATAPTCGRGRSPWTAPPCSPRSRPTTTLPSAT